MTSSSSSSSSVMIHFFLFSISLLSVSCLSVPHSPNSKPHPFLLPIKKDLATNVFYTSVVIGTPQHKMDVAIDLAGENLWYECNNQYNSSSYLPINCNTNTCPKNIRYSCSFCQGQFKPGCTNNTCGTSNYNPLAQVLFPGNIGEDVMFFSQIQVLGLSSSCTNSDEFNIRLLEKLPKTSKGIIGLARSQLALPTQLALLKKLPPKFSLCLPSSNNIGFTNLFIGPEEHEHPMNVSKHGKLQTTPLVLNPVDTGPEVEEGVSTEHFIDVTSVKIDGHVVNLKPSLLSIKKDGNGGTRMSTLTRFGELQSSVYKAFVRDFLKKAAERRMKRVASVAPLEACFDTTTIGNTKTGLAVPTIDLVLQGGAVWTIHGANSMVMVKKNVACLGFVDGGIIGPMSFVKASIVLGAHQLEENLLMFDLASNKFSFSSSLLLHNASCSHF